ncbi:hypothetical protein PVK06_040274 [Gossypium arboreum]|uniref:Arabidopsis retrotransposon Orf1 C-terminal domain-containing protein n=1 Tax=Gossypium arboreum TaxID=29729 RepID=A0ABR0N759_GOSAR|nr:hypothetical protein PVK06_040274 [Gossypium arboreum]
MIVVAEVLVIIYDFLNLDTFFLVDSSKHSNSFDCRFRISSSCGKKAVVPTSKKRKGASSSSGPTAKTVMTNYNDLGTVQFCLGGLVRQLNVPEFGTVLGFYTEEVKKENDLHALNRHIHRSLLWCWDILVPGGATYNLGRSKASTFPPSLRYLHAILAHTITGQRESTSVVNTHDAYFL